MELYYFPLGRHSQKVLIALYEKQVNFFPRVTDLRIPGVRENYLTHYPHGKLPLLCASDGHVLPESSIIIDYLDNSVDSGTRLLPINHNLELQVRLFDRLIDNDLNLPLSQLDSEQEFAVHQPQPLQLRRIERQLQEFLMELDNQLANHHWICGDGFTLADCALLPCLRHPWVHQQLTELTHLSRYQHQGNLRGSWSLVLEELELAELEEEQSLPDRSG
ncbi:glutathione S-transferase family protein [Shewanella sp. GXUN23E]|uniref:glutathione S-transferase family protein n=1 Tax=Shewanella sp. GXUN23E TaxID=3422498 RepID=UPI003D7DF7D2